MIGVFALEACSVLPSASPSSPEGWEKGWEESLVPPLGWQPAGSGPKASLIPSLSSPQSKRARGAAEGAGAEGRSDPAGGDQEAEGAAQQNGEGEEH